MLLLICVRSLKHYLDLCYYSGWLKQWEESCVYLALAGQPQPKSLVILPLTTKMLCVRLLSFPYLVDSTTYRQVPEGLKFWVEVEKKLFF